MKIQSLCGGGAGVALTKFTKRVKMWANITLYNGLVSPYKIEQKAKKANPSKGGGAKPQV